ncbi:TetR/AcrR family transcriptional regulator [Nocardia sp. NPDC088792]|uniref:TetR/AcrR family transcriptional regulator n=1 Tax=Nocardia sp. NPDC088792 TaxID=3364332 RepID=UPI00382AA693
MPDEQSLSLRERKKLDTRRALSDAALELMFERGLENVVREDIAARAGVSVRTFNNYFSSKYEALVYRQVERFHTSSRLLRERPAGEPLWTALTAAVLRPLEDDGAGGPLPTPEQLVEVRKLLASQDIPLLLLRGVMDELIAAIAERTGTDPEHDLYPRLAAGAVVAAFQAAVDTYVRTDPAITVVSLLREALTALAAGLPDPSAQHRR